MTLEGESKLFKHGKAATMYVTIPSAIVKDSSFTWKLGQMVKIQWDPDSKFLRICNHSRVKERKQE